MSGHSRVFILSLQEVPWGNAWQPHHGSELWGIPLILEVFVAVRDYHSACYLGEVMKDTQACDVLGTRLGGTV